MARSIPRPLGLAAAPLLLVLAAASAGAQPAFTKGFQPATIGPGSSARLEFSIVNQSGTPVSDLAFTDPLPAGVTIADPPSATTTCTGGQIDAPAGGGTLSFSDGGVGAFGSCTVRLDVTASAVGTHTNVAGPLTSSAGDSGTATADLVVDAGRPGFSKAFAPNPIAAAGASTLTFTVDNTANPGQALNLFFTDTLPTGLVVANPANAVNGCGGVFTATPGATSVTLTTGIVPANQSCTVSVRVQSAGPGTFANRSSSLTSLSGDSGFAVARLRALLDFLTKAFVDDPVAPGGTVTLEFTIVNFDRLNPATGISFTDDLDAALSGLTAVGLPANDVCGPGSQLSGTGLLTLTGGNLPPEGSCTFAVTLQVPAGAAAGSYTNTTSEVTADVGGVPATHPPASDDLLVQPAPLLTKEFTDDPVAAGGTVTLEFTIVNTDPGATATAIGFTDNLDALIPGTTAATLPAPGFCGPGSTLVATTGVPPVGSLSLLMSGGTLGPGASCTFQATLQLPAVSAGTYPNVTGPISGTVGGETYQGDPAADDLVVVAAPAFSKSFLDDPVAAGDTVTLEFTLTYGENAPAGATGIAFTDDLGAVIPGLAAVGLPANDVCGTGSQISGTTFLSFSGGTLGPAETCSFQVTVQVPAGAAPGTFVNTTGDLTATSLGLTVVGPPATATLTVAGLTLDKEFTDDPAVAGGTVTLAFTIANVSPSSTATGLTFTDDLNAALAGLAAVGLPANDVCGAGSQISGTTLLVFTGGTLGPGASCTFPVTLQVPGGAAPGEYTNVTSQLTGTLGGEPVVLPGGADNLLVVDALSIAKSFTDDPVPAGGTVTLEFTIGNAAASPATGIAFTDDLDAALSGLAAVGLPANGACGAGSQVAGTGLLTLTGGNLPAGGSCTFQVTLQVPAGVPAGTTAVNTTGAVTGTVGGVGVTGNAATDVLRIESFAFTKAFDGPSAAGATPTLTFTIQNLDTVDGVAGLSFQDDLGAVLPGLVAVGLPASGVCGAGSQLTGTSTVTLSGGSLGPGASCTFDVTLQVPAGAAPGSYPNVTSDLFAGGIGVANPAAATLEIEPPPAFTKSFTPASIGVGGLSTLALVIDNAASALAAAGLDVTDPLPAGVVVADPSRATTSCTGGTLTAVPGSGTVAYTGGSVGAGASCTIQVGVTASAAGGHVNVTGELTSTSGSSGTATATLTANPQPGFAKAFVPDPIAPGGVSTLTFTIDNLASSVAATDLAFTDVLPAAVTVADPAGASTTCGGGTITAVPGSGTIAYSGGSIPAATACTVQADVTAAEPGTHVNVSGALTSSLGASGTATDSLTVVAGIVSFAKEFLTAGALPGETVELEFTIVNSSPDFALTGIEFSDDLDAVLPGLAALGLPAADVCGAGSQLAGTSVIALAGGSLPAGGSCTFAVTVAVPADADPGVYENVTGALTADAGQVPVEAPPASANLVIGGQNPLEIPTMGAPAMALLAALLALAAWARLRRTRRG